MKNHILASLVFSLVLTGCGGGGGGASNNTPVVAPSVMMASLYDTSYKNFKSYPVDTLTLPASSYGTSGWLPSAIGLGEFNKQGELGVFIANQNYTTQNDSLVTVNSDPKYLSDFTFWSVNSDKTLTKISSVKGCLNPRKAVVADFNKDGIPDVFVACHGYDDAPFPGEKSKILLSTVRGSYTVSDIGDIAFTHGASAADVNNDGYPDIVVATGNDIYFYINQHNGTFSKNTTLVTNPNLPYYSVELVDVNNDGKVDLLIGGHEFQGATTKILYADGTGFGATSTTIPAIAGDGVVLDFTYIASKNQLYIERAYDSTNPSGFYGGWALQTFNMTTTISSKIVDSIGNLVGWMVPKTVNGQTGVVPYTGSNSFYN